VRVAEASHSPLAFFEAEGCPKQIGGEGFKAPKRDCHSSAFACVQVDVIHQSAAVQNKASILTDPDLEDFLSRAISSCDGKAHLVVIVLKHDDPRSLNRLFKAKARDKAD